MQDRTVTPRPLDTNRVVRQCTIAVLRVKWRQ
jgi:hypothetical protein